MGQEKWMRQAKPDEPVAGMLLQSLHRATREPGIQTRKEVWRECAATKSCGQQLRGVEKPEKETSWPQSWLPSEVRRQAILQPPRCSWMDGMRRFHRHCVHEAEHSMTATSPWCSRRLRPQEKATLPR